MKKPDSIDRKLARLLAQSAQQDSATLAKKLNISAATVRRRLRNLLKSDLIRIIGVADPVGFGLPLAVVIAFEVNSNKVESTIKMLEEEPEIRWVSSTTGRFDIIALGRFSSNDRLREFLASALPKLDGLKRSETFICFEMKKHRYIPFPEGMDSD